MNEILQWHSFPGKAGYYDLAEQEMRYNALKLPENMHGKMVLDVGAAEGWFTGKFQKAGSFVYAVEASRNPETSWVDMKRCIWINMLFDGNTGLGKGYDDSFQEYFDYIFILRCLYHFENPILALRRAYNYLKEDGSLYIDYKFANDSRIAEGDNLGIKFNQDKLIDILFAIGFKQRDRLLKYRNGEWEIWKISK